MRLTYIDHLDVFSHVSLPEGAKYSVVQLEVQGNDEEAGRGKHEAMLQVRQDDGVVSLAVEIEAEEEEEEEWDE